MIPAPHAIKTEDVPQVLIVDDDRCVLSAYSRVLGRLAIRLHLADSARAGLRILRTHSIRVVISDYPHARTRGRLVPAPGESALATRSADPRHRPPRAERDRRPDQSGRGLRVIEKPCDAGGARGRCPRGPAARMFQTRAERRRSDEPPASSGPRPTGSSSCFMPPMIRCCSPTGRGRCSR